MTTETEDYASPSTGGDTVDLSRVASGYDFTLPDFDQDGDIHYLDLSSIVPVGAKAVFFYVEINSNTAGANIIFASDGSGASSNVVWLFSQTAGYRQGLQGVLALDSGLDILYRVLTGPLTECNLVVNGYVT